MNLDCGGYFRRRDFLRVAIFLTARAPFFAVRFAGDLRPLRRITFLIVEPNPNRSRTGAPSANIVSSGGSEAFVRFDFFLPRLIAMNPLLWQPHPRPSYRR